MFVAGKLFQPSLMSADKLRAYQSEAPFKWKSRVDSWAYPLTLNYAGKGLPRTNALAY